jgi:hypothetical protein
MPRLGRKWGLWFALAGDLQAEACLLRHRHGGPLLLSSVRILEREIIHKNRDSVNGKITFNVRVPSLKAVSP